MRKSVLLIILIPLIPSLLAGEPSKHIQVAITPTSVTVPAAGTQQFSASVSGTPNKSVTWSVSVGTITSNGLFTAPAATQNTIVYLKAASIVDPNKTATATVTVSATVVP